MDIYKEIADTYKQLGTLSFALAERTDELRISKHTSQTGERIIVSFDILLEAHACVVQGKHKQANKLLTQLRASMTEVSRS